MREPKPKYKWRSRIYIIEYEKPVYSCAQRYKDKAFKQRDLNYPDGVVILDGKEVKQ